LPAKGSEGDLALRSAFAESAFLDAIEMRSAAGHDRLCKYALGEDTSTPLGPW
jgi:hypothetical protein